MEGLRLSEETTRTLAGVAGATLLGLRSLQGDASSGWLVAETSIGLLVAVPESCSIDLGDPRAEYFRLTVRPTQLEPQQSQWPGGPLQKWLTLNDIPSGALPAMVLSAAPVTGQCGLGSGHSGIELSLSSGFRVSVLSEAPSLSPLALQVTWHRQPPRLVPNNSFKPNLLRKSA